MNYNWLVVVCLMVFTTVNTCWAQENVDGCKQKILLAVKKMAQTPQFKRGQFFHYRIKTEVVYRRDLETPPTQLTTDIFISEKLAINQSNLFALYVDEHDQFLVVHPQKLVHWSKSVPNLNRDSLFRVTSAFQDSLVASAKEMKCTKVKMGGRDLLTVSFRPNPKVKEGFGMESFEVVLDLKKDRIYKVINFFDGSRDVVKQEYTYEVIDYNFKGKMPSTAKQHVFKSNNNLVFQLKDYQLIDLRNGTEQEVQ